MHGIDVGDTRPKPSLDRVVLALGAFVAGYVLVRRLRSGGATTAADDLGAETSGAEPSLEEIDERTEADARSEPAEPGEIQVDPDVVEEAVDEDVVGDEDESTG